MCSSFEVFLREATSVVTHPGVCHNAHLWEVKAVLTLIFHCPLGSAFRPVVGHMVVDSGGEPKAFLPYNLKFI